MATATDSNGCSVARSIEVTMVGTARSIEITKVSYHAWQLKSRVPMLPLVRCATISRQLGQGRQRSGGSPLFIGRAKRAPHGRYIWDFSYIIIYYRTYVGVCVTPLFFFFGVRCAQYKVHAQCSFAALAPHMPCMLLVINHRSSWGEPERAPH